MYAVILAGGSGTRLWPLSRKNSPKQFLNILGLGKTLLQATYERFLPLVPGERILVVVGQGYGGEVEKQLPDLPRRNIIIEPEGKGSAPAMGLAAAHLQRLGAKDEVMLVLPADHLIREEEKFREHLFSAAWLANEGYLVTLGIMSTRPDTGYGYIQRGDPLRNFAGHEAFRAQRFVEKPDEETARKYLDTGEYYWNSGIFVWQVSRILEEMQRLMPDLYSRLEKIAKALGTDKALQTIAENWSGIEPQTIDYGIMEKAEKVAVLPMDVGWSDVGDWSSLMEILLPDGEGNVVLGKHTGLGTRRTLIISPRTVATIGVDDLIIVDTEDAILICPRDHAQEVKDLVEKLMQEGREDLL